MNIVTLSHHAVLRVVRSHYRCRYFVLPCCAWDFTRKFSYRSADCSHYRTYLDYVRSIGVNCGFAVHEDVLRIPSTKRVSFFVFTHLVAILCLYV